MKVFVRIHVKFFKRIRVNYFKFKYSRRNPSAPENRKESGLCLTQTLRVYVSTGRTSGGRNSELGRVSAARRMCQGGLRIYVRIFKFVLSKPKQALTYILVNVFIDTLKICSVSS